MVENKHSINNILSFGTKSVNPEILENLLVGRKKTVKYLFESVETIVKHKQNQFILIIGQRGMGKTHLIRVLFHRIQPFINNNKIEVAYFSEEEYGVANYFDFLLRIINALMKWNEKDKEILQRKISELQEVPIGNREYFAETIIEEYIAKKPLLILAENFADILEAIKPKEQSKLRAWLYKSNKVSIIATSQAISKDFEREDRPLYGFFNVYYLKKLTYEDTVDFLILLAKADKRQDVIDFINNKGKGQIRALHSLVKGNHRLLVTFYQFLKTDTLADLSVNFIKTINDLKPYYETYIRNLPPQQQKVLRYIALNRIPQLGKDIAKNCFIDQKSLTKQLSELTRKKLVEAIPDPSDKRNKLYDIDEPLLRISIEVGEHKEGITAIFIDFLAIYYNENELLNKKEHFNALLEECCNGQEKIKLHYEIQAIDKALHLRKTEYASLEEKDIQKAITTYLEKNNNKRLYAFLKDEKLIKDKGEYFLNLGNYFYGKNEWNKAIKDYEKSIKINKSDSTYANWGLALTQLGVKKSDEKIFIDSIEKYKKATKLNPKNTKAYTGWGISIFNLAILKSNEKLYKESIEKYRIAARLNPKSEEILYNLGSAFFEFAKLKSDENLYKESAEYFKKATKLNPRNEDAFNSWGNVLLEYARLKSDENLYKESIEKYNNAIIINSKDAKSFNNLSIAIYFISILNKDKSLFKIFIKNVLTLINLDTKMESSYLILLKGLIYMPKSENVEIKIILDIIELISKNNLHNILSQWLFFTLKEYNVISKTSLQKLRETTIKHKDKNNGLHIIEKYIDVYQKLTIEQDKKAIYDLPKEQRLFFEEHILKQ